MRKSTQDHLMLSTKAKPFVQDHIIHLNSKKDTGDHHVINGQEPQALVIQVFDKSEFLACERCVHNNARKLFLAIGLRCTLWHVQTVCGRISHNAAASVSLAHLGEGLETNELLDPDNPENLARQLLPSASSRTPPPAPPPPATTRYGTPAGLHNGEKVPDPPGRLTLRVNKRKRPAAGVVIVSPDTSSSEEDGPVAQIQAELLSDASVSRDDTSRDDASRDDASRDDASRDQDNRDASPEVNMESDEPEIKIEPIPKALSKIPRKERASKKWKV